MSRKQMQPWDVDKPCSFRVWHKRLGKRAKVIGYSLRQFCKDQKWDWNEVVGVWISNAIEPKGVTWYEPDENLRGIDKGGTHFQKGE